MKFPRFYIISGLTAYVLAVGYGLVFRDVSTLGLFFGLPVGIALVAGLLFLFVYEMLVLGLPFVADTLLFMLRIVLPRDTYRKCEAWAFEHWHRTPKLMQSGPWMRRRYDPQNRTGPRQTHD